jgi:hypothetical protein
MATTTPIKATATNLFATEARDSNGMDKTATITVRATAGTRSSTR